VDVAPGDLDRLAGQLIAELSGPLETAVALRGRQRWVRGFEPVRSEEAPSRLVREGVYLIAEAAHGPGMAIADHLVRNLDARVALVLPPQLPPRERWETWTGLPGVPPGQDAIGTAILRLLALEREVGLDRVLILHSLDLAAVRQRFGPVHGAFFTGGTIGGGGGGLLQLKTPEALHAALDPLSRSVEAFLSAVDQEPPAFVLLSSTTPAVTGSLGQLEVAAAGSYLDALAARRTAEGRPFTLAVHWDPYQWGGWLVTGVAGGMSGLAPEEVQANLESHGVTPAKSAAALERLLAAPYPRVIVSSQSLHGLIAETDSVTADTLFAATSHQGEKAPRPGLSTPFEPPADELEERLALVWQDLFGIVPIGRGDSFLELGGHSLLAIQMVTQIRAALEVDLPVTALFESPTVAELAKAVRRARGEEDQADLEALLALVEGLSPEEAAEKLAEMEV
jgi:acyl carrier protein